MARSAAPHQLATAIAAGLAITGLLLALTGVYAMSAVGASERRHEMGVRAALGASPGEVFWLVLRDSTSTVIAGSACGLVAAVAISQLLQARVFGVAGTDLAWLIPVCAVGLTTAGVIASAVPARQAAVADPLASVKAD